MKIITIMVMLLVSTVALADKSLIMGGFSHHTSKGYTVDGELIPWNENNPLIAVEYNGYLIGEMTNSYNEDTTFVGYHHEARVLGLMFLASNKYKRSQLPRVGSIAVGGFLTAKVGPLLFLTIPGNVYVVTIQVKL